MIDIIQFYRDVNKGENNCARKELAFIQYSLHKLGFSVIQANKCKCVLACCMCACVHAITVVYIKKKNKKRLRKRFFWYSKI